jgi:hypothetical protein
MINKTKLSLYRFFIVTLFLGILIPSHAQSLPSLVATSEFTLFTGAETIFTNGTVSNSIGNTGAKLGTIIDVELSNVTGTFINANLITRTPKQDLILAYTMFPNLSLTAAIYSIANTFSYRGILVLAIHHYCENNYVFETTLNLLL